MIDIYYYLKKNCNTCIYESYIKNTDKGDFHCHHRYQDDIREWQKRNLLELNYNTKVMRQDADKCPGWKVDKDIYRKPIPDYDKDFINWYKTFPSNLDIYNACERGDWLINWIVRNRLYHRDVRQIGLISCLCARLSIRYISIERLEWLKLIIEAESCLRNKKPEEELEILFIKSRQICSSDVLDEARMAVAKAVTSVLYCYEIDYTLIENQLRNVIHNDFCATAYCIETMHYVSKSYYEKTKIDVRKHCADIVRHVIGYPSNWRN